MAQYGILCALALLSGVVGCGRTVRGLLDGKEESNDIYENMVFSDPYNATWFLSNIYKSMNDGFMHGFGSDGRTVSSATPSTKASGRPAGQRLQDRRQAWATTDMLLNYDPWKILYGDPCAAARVFWNMPTKSRLTPERRSSTRACARE